MIRLGTRIGRYRVIDRIGSGGMGVVYAAEDTVLGRKVALKFLSSMQDGDLDRGPRIAREARAASRLDHPNICTIHELGETEDGRPFIAMAYYEGRSLQDILSDGAFDSDQALNVAQQLARGLAHAHRRGVVHRDIKPGNLWLLPDGTLKVLDFGIARRTDQELSSTGPRAGTIAYMSPEQLRDEDLDARSDVWSAGVVLYQLLSGGLPFRGQTEAAVMYQILNGEPEPLDGALNTPSSFCEIVHRCLSKAPKERFESGQALLEGLEAVGGDRESEATERHPRRSSALTNTFAAAIVALGVLLALTPPGQMTVKDVFARVFTDDARYVAVLPFSSSDSAYAPEAIGLTQSLTELATSLAAADDALWVLPFSDMANAGVSSVLEARRAYPVDLVIRGNVVAGVQGTILELEVWDARRADPRLLATVTAPADSRAAVIRALSDLLAGRLGLPSGDVRRIQNVSGQESPAYALYTSGLGLLHRAYSEGNIERAVRLFQDAIELDSLFVPAYAGLCQASWERYMRSGEVSLADTASVVCADAVSRSDSDPRALNALARTQIQSGRPAEAEESLRRAISLDNSDADAYRWLGRALEDQRQLEEASDAYREAIRLQPDIWTYPFELGLMLSYAERHSEAIALFERVIALAPDNYRGYNMLGFAHLLSDRLEEAEAALLESLATRENFLAYRNLALLRLREAEYSQALDATDRALAIMPLDWWAWRWRAHSLHWMGEPSGARVAWERVAQLTEERLSVNPNEADALSGRAESLIQLGSIEEGREHLDRLMVLGETTGYNTLHVGRILEMLGSRAAAVQQIRRAEAMGVATAVIESDPWLSDLIRDPLYLEGQR